MNIDELKQNWEALYGEQNSTQNEADIRRLITNGASEKVSKINRKLFKDVLITGIATIVSVVGVIFFYFRYDPVEHPWIDASQLLPIQLLAFGLFLMLFVFAYAEYRMVNRKYTANTLCDFLSATVRKSKKYYWVSTIVILVLLFLAFLLELNYFVNPDSTIELILTYAGAIILTGLSYVVMRYYYLSNFAQHFQSLQDYRDELAK